MYGIEDVTLPGERPAWVIFPSDDGAVWDAPIRPGTYPLIVFVHGSRNANDGVLCPPDISQDYQAWLPVLHLLARCGFVVLVPSMHDVLFSAESGAAAIGDAVDWMHFGWPQRVVLWRPGVFESPMMYREKVEAESEAESSEVRDLSALGMRFLGEGIGTDDLQNASYLTALWNSLPAPRRCPVGWLTAAELVLGFMTKRLLNRWYLPPHLLGPAGDRTPLMPYYDDRGNCALKVRWNDPQVHQNTLGDITFGEWDSGFDPW